MRRLAILGLIGAIGLIGLSCSERVPPPGSGSLETTPTGTATRPPERLSATAVLPYPNGAILTTDPGSCRVRLLRDGTTRWDHEFRGCAGFLEANVAMDSTLYVRDPQSLSSFGPNGALLWTQKLTEAAPAVFLAVPAVLADSRVALATTTRTVTAYERNGSMAWSFSLPGGEELIVPPSGMKTEGMVVATSKAVYYLGATGEIRWRVANPGAKRP